jgi:glycosyltransferase involved in cell wall biosynthesis
LKDIDVTFIIPKLPQQIDVNNFKLINASLYKISKEKWKTIYIESNLLPYQDYICPDGEVKINCQDKFDSDLYGVNLISEVERFALIASEIVKDIDCDIIHVHDWMTGIAGIQAKKILKKPLVMHIHSTEYDRTAGWPNLMILNYEKVGLQNADLIIAISEYTKNILIDRYSIPSDKIEVVHNAINPKINSGLMEKTISNDKIVLFLARLSIQKGADFLLKAAQKVLQIKRNVKFVIVGKGPMLKTLINLAISLDISDNVIFTGALSHEDVDKAYRYADLFVMPSVSEPFGLTCLEAIKNGTPVIISKQSGVSEVVKNCLKVDYWDIDMMASKIISVLNHDSLSESLSENGYFDLRGLTWDKQADKVIAIYQKLISK